MTNAQTLFLHKLLDYAAKTGICSNWPNCKELKVCGDAMADQVCLMTWHGSLAIITSVLNHGIATHSLQSEPRLSIGSFFSDIIQLYE